MALKAKNTAVTVKIQFAVEAEKDQLAGAVEAAKKAVLDSIKLPKRVRVEGAKVTFNTEIE